MIIPCQRHLFDLPDDRAYLNCAYMGPLMHDVVDAVAMGAARKATPWTLSPEDFFTETMNARSLFARLCGATANDIAVVPAASYGLAVAQRNIPVGEGQRIIVLKDQFPSNVYGWRELAAANGAEVVTLERGQDGDWTRVILDAIDERTALAALAQNHWTDGSLIDLERVGAQLRDAGAALVLDLTQSLGAMPFDVKTVKPDFMVAACYKWLLGPYTIGFLYADPKWHGGEPIEQSWMIRSNAEDFAGLVNYVDGFRPGAHRFDMGEFSNFALMPGAIAAMEKLLEWTPEAIAETLGNRTRDIAERAARLGLRSPPDGARAPHFLGLSFPEAMPPDLVGTLAARNVHVSVRGQSMRVTPHLYNNDDDVARLMDALGAVL
ncbi:MAG: aminotransferase class V-fold PLP-dependent enzyme [Minwuia sp.]|uniref:aminotransferase class V-fold PLP-dependent enzyme n=1 Tax=Minwuia sp. TaxID=2493630 RepID=UPI003A8A8BCE